MTAEQVQATRDTSPQQGQGARFRAMFSNQALSLFVILALMWIVLGVLSPAFRTGNNLLQVTLQAAVMALIAAGETFVIISGGIDLSVGSIFAFSAMLTGLAVKSELGAGGAILVGLAAGAFLGFINGLGVGWLKLPAFIVTLGMMSVARGLALLANNGVPIFGLPEGMAILGQGRINLEGIIVPSGREVSTGIPVPTIIVIAVFALSWFLLRYTSFGRFTYAIGSNTEASRLSGVRITRNLIGIYVLCGVFTALAALVESSRLNSFQPASGQGYELDAIGAVVIGGTSLMGGEGNILASLVGA
ncbi:MAG: ABC transporter permease, partial [Anaerolineae bacterium]|nr:ABC transporter permease [Anaerolineae bacterium]